MRIRIDKEIPQMISTEKANFRMRSSSTVAVRIAVFLVLFTGTSLIAAEPMPVIGQPTSVLNFVWHPHSAGLISTGKFNGLGQWMFTVGDGNRLKACELNQLVRLPNHSNSLAISGRPALIVVGTNVGTVELYDDQSLRLKKQFKVGPEYSVYAVAIDTHAKRVAACGTDGTVLVWDLEAGRQIHHFKQASREGERMAALAFSPDGESLATLSRYGFLSLWDLSNGQRIGKAIDRSGGEESALKFSTSGDRIVVVERAMIRIWHPTHEPEAHVIVPPEDVCPRHPKAENSFPRSGPDFGNGIRFAGVTTVSSDLKRAATVLESGGIAIWELTSAKTLATLPPAESMIKTDRSGSDVRHIAFSPDESKIAVSTGEGVLAVWQIK